MPDPDPLQSELDTVRERIALTRAQTKRIRAATTAVFAALALAWVGLYAWGEGAAGVVRILGMVGLGVVVAVLFREALVRSLRHGIELRQLTIVDTKGHARAWIGTEGGSPRAVLLDEGGRARAEIGLLLTGETRIAFYSNEGKRIESRIVR